MADNQIAHVRHKADKTAYLLEDGTVVGDVKKKMHSPYLMVAG